MSEHGIKNKRTNGNDIHDEQRAINHEYKYAGLGAAIAAELMIGFWFGIGVILAIGVVNGLNHCVEMLMSSK